MPSKYIFPLLIFLECWSLFKKKLRLYIEWGHNAVEKCFEGKLLSIFKWKFDRDMIIYLKLKVLKMNYQLWLYFFFPNRSWVNLPLFYMIYVLFLPSGTFRRVPWHHPDWLIYQSGQIAVLPLARHNLQWTADRKDLRGFTEDPLLYVQR